MKAASYLPSDRGWRHLHPKGVGGQEHDVSKADEVRVPRTRGQSARSCVVKTELFETWSWWKGRQPAGHGMITCARCCRESSYFPAKLPSRPAHKEWEATDGTPQTRSETSRATWGWPKACEGQGHGGVIVLSHQKLFEKEGL